MLRLQFRWLIILFFVSTCAFAHVDSLFVKTKIRLLMSDADTSHINPVKIYFGIDPHATDCVDTLLGESDVITGCGGSPGYCARFQDPFGPFSLCLSYPQNIDLRPYKKATQVDIYKITFSGTYPIVFSWPGNLYEYYDSAYIYDGLCGCLVNVDMFAHSSVVVSTPIVSTLFIRTRGPFASTGVQRNNSEIPLVAQLEQNYPNPFNPSTTIHYELPSESYVTVKIFDILGREIETLVQERQSVGSYDVQWHAEKNKSGVYFYRLTTGTYSVTKKMAVIR